MTKQLTNYIKLTAIAASIGLISGCAGTKLETLQTELDNLKGMAEQASTDAGAAKADASAAKDESAAALALAQEAKGLAQGSADCCAANKEEMSRMFDAAQQK